MEKLHIYNTLTRKKEEFIPITPGFVGIYVCGPTVYAHSHLGHAKSYISFDVVVRYLRYLGYKVRYVQNLTDVGHLLGDAQEGEDRIAKQARLEQQEPMEVVERYARSFFDDMDRLGLVRPDISPRASGHIIEQIEVVKQLIEKDLAYEVNGNVYFSVKKFPGYGKLSGRKIDELDAGARVAVSDEKRHPADFALWKSAGKEHLMQWNSPWGMGYPGWHIECSCMSTKYLGKTIDIHGGGLENMFPHHECEIAQSEGAFDQQFVNYWMHNNMVNIDNVKMSKSLQNFVTIKDTLKKYNPRAVRYFILMSHYRSVLDFSDSALTAAEKGLKKLQNSFDRVKASIKDADDGKSKNSLPITEFENNFRSAMNDDFNTPQAIAIIFDLFSKVNKHLDDHDKWPDKDELLKLQDVVEKTAGGVLGLLDNDSTLDSNTAERLDGVMNVIINIRNELRQQKNYQLSDQIRDDIENIGIKIKDTADGATWEFD